MRIFRGNIKIFAMSLVAILFAVAGILSCCFLIPTRTESVSADSSLYAGGDGLTSDTPYIIETAGQLREIATNVSKGETGKFYKVVKPINLSGSNWTPIGTSSKPFVGSIDFGNNPVVGMKVSGAYDAAGFIGYAETTTISNAIFMNSQITVNETSVNKCAVGELIGCVKNSLSKVTIQNVMCKGGKITVNGDNVSIYNGIGGLIGSVVECKSGSIKNVLINTQIEAKNRKYFNAISPVVGYCEYSEDKPKISIDDAIVDVKITYNTSNVKSYGSYIGDFVSESNSNGTDWFYMSGINGGVPALKSQFWVGQNSAFKDLSGANIVSRFSEKKEDNTLVVKGAYTNNQYKSASASDLIPKATTYTPTLKVKVQGTIYDKNWANIKVNGQSRPNFSVAFSSSIGYPDALLGEKITLSYTTTTGYYFSKYTVEENAVNSPYVVTGNTTLIAEFLPKKYTLTANATKGEIFSTSGWTILADLSTATKPVTYDAAYGTLPEPKKAGYVFDGWYTSSSAGSKIKASTIYNLAAGNSTIYAHWTKNTYTVTINPNGGSYKNSTSISSVSGSYGTSTTISDPTRTGYTFAGWIATKTINGNEWMQILYHNNLSGTQLFSYSDELETNVRNDTYRNSQFANLEKLGLSEYEFLLQYDSLPGEYNQWSQTSNPAKTTESVTGYSAKRISWNNNGLNGSNQFGGIAKSSNTSTFIDGTVGHDYWYYALGCYKAWKGGIPGPKKAEINCVYLWLSTSGIKPTEVFSDKDALGNSNTYYFKNESVTLKALWMPNTHQVKYNANGGSGTMNNSTHTYDEAKNLTANGFTKTGYTFAGWARSANGPVVYSDKQSVKNLTSTQGDTVNLYAKWTANKYNIIYTLNGGTATNPKTYTIEDTIMLNKPTRTGYTFTGWTGSNGDTPQTTVTIPKGSKGDRTYTANWTANKYTVTFDKQTGSGGTTSLTVTYNSKPSNITGPTTTGYTFRGYYTSAYGEGTQYFDARGVATCVWDIASDTTLYACWAANTYTLTSDENNKAAATLKTTNVTYGHTYASARLSTPTKDGYTFDGWRIGPRLINETTFNGNHYIPLGRTYMYEDKITVMVRAYMDNWSEYPETRLISCTEGGGWNIENIDGGYIQFACYDKGAAKYKPAKGSKKWSELAAGWHTFIGDFDGSYARVYVDGQLLGTSAAFSSGGIGYNSTNGIFVGAEAGSSGSTPAGGYFKGKISYVSIINSVSTISWSTAHPAFNTVAVATWTAKTYNIDYYVSFTGDAFNNITTTGTYDKAINISWNTSICQFSKTVLTIARYGTGGSGSEEINVTNSNTYTWTMKDNYNTHIWIRLSHVDSYYSSERMIKIQSPSETDGFGVTIKHEGMGILTKPGENKIPGGGNYPSGTIDFKTKSRMAGQKRRTIKVKIYGLSSAPEITNNDHANSFNISQQSLINSVVMTNYYLITFESRAGINLYSSGTVKFNRPDNDRDIFIEILYENT